MGGNMVPNKEKLEEIIRSLQVIMRIQDWDIEFEYLSAVEMYNAAGDITTIASCERDRAHLLALIRFNYEGDKTGDVVGGWYHTIVHEMFHIVVDVFDESDTSNLQKEKLINNLTRIFVSLYPVTNFIKEEA